MSDGYIKIDTKIDETGIDKGIGNVDKKLKGSTKNIGSLTSGLAKASIAGVGVAVALKKAADTIADLTDAYKKQAKAETQLEAAAKNNPYLTPSSVKALKDYASELQSISTVGDEELLPHMASLAAAGRTQDEIMQIMSASLDMAASGSFTLDSAVRNLNKAYGGLSGELGESIPEIKALTAEQLKNGAATKLMGDRYKGIAAETAKATGSSEQLANAIGDAKEELGYGWEKSLTPFRMFITEVISGWAAAKKAQREAQEEKDKAFAGEETIAGATYAVADIQKNIDGLLEQIRYAENEGKADLIINEIDVKKFTDALRERVQVLKDQLAQMRSLEIRSREGAKADEAAALAASHAKNESKAYTEYIANATAARDKAIEAIKLKAAAEGVEVDELDILNVNMGAYVSLVSESNGLVTASSAIAREWLATAREQGEALKIKNDEQERANELEQEMRGALDAIQAPDDRTESQKMRDQMAELNDVYSQVMSNEQIAADQKLIIWQEYEQKKAQLEKNITETEKEELKAREQANKDQNVKIAEIASQFADQFADTMRAITDLANQMIDDDTKVKIAKLDEQYEAGEISAEEYEEKKIKIEKKAAKEKYKVAMWQWGADIAKAIANTALGITMALAMGGPFVGPILAGMIGAAGAVQLATLISSKPIPPSFSTGGVISSSSTVGDRTLIAANGKERVLTAQQNAAFENLAYGGVGGGTNVKIYNTASNDVNASAKVTKDGIEVLIGKTVNKKMANGEFNSSYKIMQNELNGIRYTN
jgi:hypothetical protein